MRKCSQLHILLFAVIITVPNNTRSQKRLSLRIRIKRIEWSRPLVTADVINFREKKMCTSSGLTLETHNRLSQTSSIREKICNTPLQLAGALLLKRSRVQGGPSLEEVCISRTSVGHLTHQCRPANSKKLCSRHSLPTPRKGDIVFKNRPPKSVCTTTPVSCTKACLR